jgi:hypothetical protein
MHYNVPSSYTTKNIRDFQESGFGIGAPYTCTVCTVLSIRARRLSIVHYQGQEITIHVVHE